MKDNEIHILFEKLKLGNEDILEVIYNKYGKMVYSIAFSIVKNRESAEDIKQNVFVKIFKLDKNNLPSNYETSWLYQVTKNESINYIKKNKEFVDIEEIYNISFEDTELKDVIDRDYYNRIIRKLDKKDQEIVSLKILGDRNFREISEMLKIPSGTVKWRYYKAISNLKPLIANLCMFIISLSITLKTTLSTKNIDNNIQASQQIEDNSAKDEIIEESVSEENKEVILGQETELLEDLGSKQEADIKENIREDTADVNKNKTETVRVNENQDIENKIENEVISNEIFEEIQIKNIESKNVKFEGVMISITTLFFIATIIVMIIFIKSQQKIKKNMSKL